MKHNFEERRQNRQAYAEKQAEKNKEASDQLYHQAKEMASIIPLGQPILVGHHSEKRDRNYRNKIHNTFGKAFEAMDKAKYYADKAATIASNDAIFSDDPNALEKLKGKLAELQQGQAFMKEANKCIRKQDKAAFLQLHHATEALWEELNKSDSVHRKGYASFSLQNNNANIARIKKRISLLEAQSQLSTQEETINGVRLVVNVEANRVQLVFPGIPPEQQRKQLKQNGFRWSPSESAWQRHLTPAAFYIAKHLLQSFIK
ncbi:MAG: DUF3560 domain-containing protein [Chitinophagaceae bacterium]|nr:MAG: DUF3560 domain-containing protein [Chitinophagaceae bacterium]